MSKFLQAAEAIKKLAKQQEHLVTAAAILEEIGSLEQACDERKAALAEADKNLVQAKEYLLEENERLIRIRKSMDDAIAVANTDAAIAASKEKTRLDTMIVDAQAEAKRIVDAAKASGDKIVSDAQAAAESLQTDIGGFTFQIDALKSAADDKRAELARLDEAIAKARGKVAGFMEG